MHRAPVPRVLRRRFAACAAVRDLRILLRVLGSDVGRSVTREPSSITRICAASGCAMQLSSVRASVCSAL
jgi:hypothetical protein